MSEKSFYALTQRAVTALSSRRGVLSGLTSGLLAILPLALGSEDTAARHKHRHRHRRKHRKTHQHQGSPPSPPAVMCPPVCPVCQTCDVTTGVCEASPSGNGLAGQDCGAPRVCCSGTCCDPIHACNGLAGFCSQHCTTTADCTDGQCITSFTERATNVTSQLCGQPVGSGVCGVISACA